MAARQSQENFCVVLELGAIDPVVAQSNGAQLRRQFEPVFLDPAMILLQHLHQRDQLGVAASQKRREHILLFVSMMLARSVRKKTFDHACPTLGIAIDADTVDMLRQLHQHGQMHQHLLMARVLRFKTGRWFKRGCTHNFSGSKNCEYRMVAERASALKTFPRANP